MASRGPSQRYLRDRLSILLGEELRLVITDNTRTLISGRRKGGQLTVRLHHMFLDAPDSVIRAVSDHLRGRRRARGELDRYIVENQHLIRVHLPSERRRSAAGRWFDLATISGDLNRRFLGDAFEGRICWGRRPPKRRRRTIRLGSYDYHERLIRIHPSLDQSFVPLFFVEWVVFHEMLHQIVPGSRLNGRRAFHTDEFKALERTFPDYERAKRWERRNVSRLLKS